MTNGGNQFCGRTRREFLWQAGGGFGAAALSGLLGDDFFASQALAADGQSAYTSPLAPKKPHFKAKAKSVIFLFMYGGPSQVDTFDYKPELYPLDGKTIPVKTFGRGARRTKAAWSAPSGPSSPTGNAASSCPTSFPTWAPASTTSPSCTR